MSSITAYAYLISFLLSAPIRKVSFDKKTFKMTIEKVNVICKKKIFEHNLGDIRDLVIQKRGKVGVSSDTTHYVIVI
jgi:hypothetical protein